MIVVSIVGLVALLAIGQSHKSSATGRSGLRLVGNQAPEFSIPSYQGDQVVLSDIRGRPVVINFWASWCPPCRAESAMLESLWREYESAGIYFLGVNIQDSREAAEAYIEEFGITFVNGVDRDGRVSIDYGVIGLPATFFVNGEGVIVGRWVGAMSEQDLRGWVNDLLEKSFTTSRSSQISGGADQD